MTQTYSFPQSSSLSLESPSPPELPPPRPVAMPQTSQPQFTPYELIDPPPTPNITPPPSYKPRHYSDAPCDLEAGTTDPKATSKHEQATVRPRYSCCNFLSDAWTLLVSLAFITLVCTILIFVVGTVLTDIGAHLLVWDHHPDFLVLLTWPYTLAAVALGSAILGSVFAFLLFLLGMHPPSSDAILDARPGLILPPCVLGGTFALPVGLAAIPRDMPLTWKDALITSAAGVIGTCAFVLICTIALLAGGMLLSTISLRRTGRAKDVRSGASGCAV
ncbi:hypothetical protein GSI_02347 [Ganoderma sinense ZZ0214-1]|uniref:Uncharacterized protein n=1 Tax=Ganoderma sinense ZZ0214-1 TaxID=1077348 RepID=A0A2G8SPC6_9APHY|nr:hypothetical protein GSI_02347 [Ganoderma sinense ZZ0214-1]